VMVGPNLGWAGVAMSLRDELHTIYQQTGELTPKGLVAHARDEHHALHDRFEWDDEVAGGKYRLHQARDLIRSVKIEFGPDSESVNEFVSVARPTGTTYVPVSEVAADPFTAELVLRTAEREWRAMRRRYGHLSQFLALVRAESAETPETGAA